MSLQLQVTSIALYRQLSRILARIGIPLLVFLHVIFSLFSLSLRIFQAFTTPTSQTVDIEHVQPPQHVGLVLVPSNRRGEARKKERDGLVESVKRTVEWASARGIKEISVWDGQGLIQSVLPTLIRTLATSTNLPPSPPDSPRLKPVQGSKAEALVENKAHKRQLSEKTLLGAGVTSITVWSTVTEQQQTKELLVHLMPPSSTVLAIAGLAKSYAACHLPIQDANVSKVDEDMKKHLHFQNYPDLLIVHHLSPLSPWASLLPRRAPELWGYPFWALRITEIYQPSTPIPVLHHFTSFINIFRASSLPFLRKMGYKISAPPSPAESALSREEWDGAMRAWIKVEQRLGR
ncbi:hypothetical protein L204_100333 [Cryptococcus depauperatus]